MYDILTTVIYSPPLEVDLVQPRPEAVGRVLVDRVQNLGLDLGDGIAVEHLDHDVLVQLVLHDAADHGAGHHGLPQQAVLGKGVPGVVRAGVHRTLLHLGEDII